MSPSQQSRSIEANSRMDPNKRKITQWPYPFNTRRNNKAYRTLLHAKKYLQSTTYTHARAISIIQGLSEKMQHATERQLVTSPTVKHFTSLLYNQMWHCAKLVQFSQPINAHCQQQCDSSVIKRAQNMYTGQTFQPSVRANSQEASPSTLPWVYPCGNPPILDLGHGASTIYGQDTQDVSFRPMSDKSGGLVSPGPIGSPSANSTEKMRRKTERN